MPDSPQYEALVYWTAGSDGGLSEPPTSLRLMHPAHFAEDGPRWPTHENWSVVLELDAPPTLDAGPSRGRVSFLFPDGPHKRLQPGRTFDYYMGVRKIARIEVGERVEWEKRDI